MDRDRAKWKIKKVAGKLQKVKGNLTHSNSDKIVGTAKEVEGTIGEKLVQAKDAVRKAIKDS